MIEQPGNMEIQLDLFLDYPAFQGVLPQIEAATACGPGQERPVPSFRQAQKLIRAITPTPPSSF
jgi:hypothetical protein